MIASTQASAGATPPLRFGEEQLDLVSADVLKSMSRTWGGKGNENKAACIRLILRGLSDASTVQAALARLKPEDRAALAIVKEHGGVIRTGMLDCMLQSYGYPVAEKDDRGYGPRGDRSRHVAELVRKGYLLMAGINHRYHSAYDDVRWGGLHKGAAVYADERILRQVNWPLKVRALPLAPTADAPKTPTFRRPPRVMLDLAAVTQTLFDMDYLGLTKDQSIRKPDLRKFAKRLGWGEAPSFDGHAFPGFIAAVLAAWRRAGWLQGDDEVLCMSITPDEFMQQPLLQQISLLANGFLQEPDWIEMPDAPLFGTDRVGAAHCAVFHALRALPEPGHFYALPDFAATLYDRIGESVATQVDYEHAKPPPWNMSNEQYKEALAEWRPRHRDSWIKRESVFIGAVLTTWVYWLGLVETGRLATDTLAFRLTDLGRQLFGRYPGASSPAAPPAATDHPAWVVQPNHDVVVYLDAVSPAQLAFLEQHGERRQADAHTAHYQLTRESVYRGLQRGTTIDEVLATLRTGARGDLPQNVEREITEWGQRREQLTITKKTRVIAFRTQADRDWAMRAGLQGKPVGETHVLSEMRTSCGPALEKAFGNPRVATVDYAARPLRCLRAREDGTLILTEDTWDLLVRGQLSRCAEPVDARCWRLTAESLAVARRAGVTTGILLEFLQARLVGAMPPLLEVAIRNALGTRPSVQGDVAFVLRIVDSKLHTAIANSPAMKPYLLDVPGPDTVIVSLDRLDEFKARLNGLGVKLTAYAPTGERPDWQQTVRDAMSQQRRRNRG